MKQKKLFFLIAILFILISVYIRNPLGPTDEELARLAADAVEDGNTRKLRLLVLKGADVNVSDEKGKTLLEVALDYGQYDIAKYLIAKGLDVNKKDAHGMTPLGLTVGGYRNRRELPEARDSDGYYKRGDYFYRQDEFERAIEDYSSAIRLNAENDRAYYLRGRAWAKKDESQQAVADWTKAIELDWRNALHSYYTRRLLQSPSAELDHLIKDTTMEHLEGLEVVSGYAVGYGGSPGDFYIVSLIISNPFEEEKFFRMAQSISPVIRAMAMICLTRENRFKYESKIRSFYTDTAEVKYMPMGCLMGRITLDKLARSIIDDPNVLDYWSASHTDWKFSTFEFDSRQEDLAQRQMCIIRALIAQGADANQKDKLGETPLHYAAEHGSRLVAELLITNGANVNIKNNNGETPLHCATFWGYRQMVKLLIASGADIAAKTNEGQTALDIATQQDYPGLGDLLRGFEQKK